MHLDENKMVDEFISYLADKYSKDESEICAILMVYSVGKILIG